MSGSALAEADEHLKLVALQARVDALEKQVADAQSDAAVESFRLSVIPQSFAKLDAASKTYTLIETAFGAFPVVIESAKPYLDGYNLELLIGNPTSIAFRQAKLSFYWGNKSNKTIDAPNDFYPDRYTRVEANISPAKEDDLKNLSLGIAFNTISIMPAQ